MRLKAHQYLENRGIPYQARQFPSETEKGAASVARVLGFRERQMVKTLIFATDKGETVLVMVGGDQSAVSGNLKRVVGSRNVSMADGATVVAVTGYTIGSIPPFSWQPAGYRSFVEQTLLEEEWLGVGAGVWGEEIIIKPADLVRASGAQVVNLTDRTRPAAL